MRPFSAIELARMSCEFESLRAGGFSGAVAVSSGDETPLRRVFGTADPVTGRAIGESTLFDIASVTKTFTAAAVLHLAREDRLGLRQTLGEVLSTSLGDKRGITVQQILTHTSGLADFLGPEGGVVNYDRDYDFEPVSRDEFLSRVVRSPLQSPPGERWSYSNAGYSLLAVLIEERAAVPFETYLQRHLLLPLGLRNTGYRSVFAAPGGVACGLRDGQEWAPPAGKSWAHDGPFWNLRGNGGLLSTVDDLLRWSRRLVSTVTPSLERMLFSAAVPVDRELQIDCGYGWYVRRSDSSCGRMLYHNGSNEVFTATVRVFPEIERFVVVLGNHAEHSAMHAAKRLVECWDS
jgi:CubicO group peptidase (beta-lactamase class C family)